MVHFGPGPRDKGRRAPAGVGEPPATRRRQTRRRREAGGGGTRAGGPPSVCDSDPGRDAIRPGLGEGGRRRGGGAGGRRRTEPPSRPAGSRRDAPFGSSPRRRIPPAFRMKRGVREGRGERRRWTGAPRRVPAGWRAPRARCPPGEPSAHGSREGPGGRAVPAKRAGRCRGGGGGGEGCGAGGGEERGLPKRPVGGEVPKRPVGGDT